MHNDINGFDITSNLLQSMLEVFHDLGFKVTNQRKIILEAVAHQVGWHVHPKDIYSYVAKKDPNIGMATVYRTLKMLEDMDLLNKVYLMGTQDLKPSTHGVHYHLVCLKCGKIIDAKDMLLEDINSKIKKKYGFIPTQTKLSFFGMCKECDK